MDTVLPLLTIINYFKALHINYISAIFACSSEEVKVHALKELSKYGLMASFSMDSIKELAETRNGAFLDVSCISSENILETISNKRLFSMDREWLLLETTNERGIFNGTYSSQRNKELYILPGSTVTLVQFSPERGEMAFYDMYRIITWSTMMFDLMTIQETNKYHHIPPRKERTDFQGVTLRTGTAILVRDKFKGFGSFEYLEADFYAKSTIFVARDVAFQFNFSTTILVEDTYGYKGPDGNFEGLMGKIQRNEIDFVAAGVIMWEDRYPMSDFTGSVYKIRCPIIFRQPSLSTVSNIFLLPFSRTVWCTSGATSLVFILGLVISYSVGKHLKNLMKRFDLSFSEILTTILSCICQQGPNAINEAPRARIALFLFELFVFFLFVAYSAKIVALLQTSVQIIKTISDLTNSPLEVGLQDISYNHMYFEATNDSDLKNFYLKKIKPHKSKVYLDPTIGLRRLKSEMYAFKVESDWANRLIASTFVEKEKCGLGEINIFDIPIMTIPVPKRSGLREHITRSITRQMEVGLLTRVTKPFTSRKPKCNASKLYSSVSLVDFKPALVALVFGAILSLAFLLSEIFFKVSLNAFSRYSAIIRSY